MVTKLLLAFALIIASAAIGIPIRRYEMKCMIVYTVGESDSVKINAKLPEIPDKLQDEFYEIFIKNTQTNEEVAQRSLPGVYKRELSLTSNIIYEVCFRIRSDRDFGKMIIQYTAENLFNLQHSEIKVPQNLLKSGDFKQAYQHAQKLFSVTEKFTQLQKQRKQTQSQTFVKTTQLSKNLLYISIIEIGIIIVASLYQFLALRKYLTGKHYI